MIANTWFSMDPHPRVEVKINATPEEIDELIAQVTANASADTPAAELVVALEGIGHDIAENLSADAVEQLGMPDIAERVRQRPRPPTPPVPGRLVRDAQ